LTAVYSILIEPIWGLVDVRLDPKIGLSMGNDHSSAHSVSAIQQQPAAVKRRESIAMVRSTDEMPISAQFEMRRRRISSCVIGIHPQKNQQQNHQNYENNLVGFGQFSFIHLFFSLCQFCFWK
jgi:hypothetical protein